MSINYTELIEELRQLAAKERDIADDAFYDPEYAPALEKAADAIETLSKDVDKYADAAFERAQQNGWLSECIKELEELYSCKKKECDSIREDRKMLFDRLSHLLQSKLIRMYDERELITGKYSLDINHLDISVDMMRQDAAAMRLRIEELEQAAHRDAAATRAAEAAAMYADIDTSAPVWIASRKSILEDAEKCVCGHREEDYGSPEDSFATIAELWTTYSGYSFTAVDVAMMMALLKIARIAGGRGSEDSFVDLAGYAACGGEIWSMREAAREVQRG